MALGGEGGDDEADLLGLAADDGPQVLFEPLTSPSLGDDSWAAQGNLAAQVITYAFRRGNLVVVTSYTTQTEALSESAALAAAQRAADRLESA